MKNLILNTTEVSKCLNTAGGDKYDTGEEILFTINPHLDNLISNNQDVSVYWKFIDFYHSEMNQQTKFLYSLANVHSESISGHDYTTGSICNMITCGVIKWNFEYIRGEAVSLLLLRPVDKPGNRKAIQCAYWIDRRQAYLRRYVPNDNLQQMTQSDEHVV